MNFMKHFKIISLFILVVLFCCSCEEENEASDFYQYSGYDSTGVQVVEGAFTINEGDSTNISGAWIFQAIGDPQNIGPQLGEGTFIGTIIGDEFAVSLNPAWRDNNVFLNGTIVGDKITGHWVYATIIGITSQGSFMAAK